MAKTTIVTDKIPRWTGTVQDIVHVAQQTKELVQKHTHSPPPCHVIVTQSKVETNFEELDDFASSTQENLSEVEKISLTIGDFNADTPLSARIEFDRTLMSPGVLLRVRGHDDELVDGIIERLRKMLHKGRRWFSWGYGPIQWIVLIIYVAAFYAYVEYIGLPRLDNDLIYYLFTILIVALPTVAVILVIKMINWYVPTLELRPTDMDPRSKRYRTRAIAFLSTTVIGSFAVPLLLAWVKVQLNLK